MLAVHLIFSRLITDNRAVSAKLMERFDIQRVVYLKKSPKERTFLKSAVVIFNSSLNLKELSKPNYLIGDLVMSVVHISFEDAEDLIDQKKTKLYVGNIPYPVDNHAIWNHFAQYGQLDYCYILKAPVQRGPKGFGFVIYKHRDSARNALSVMNYMCSVKLKCKLFLNKTKLKSRNNIDKEDSSLILFNRVDQEKEYEGFDNSQYLSSNTDFSKSERHYSHLCMNSSSPSLTAVQKCSSKARFARSFDEKFGNLMHATILGDEELPIIIPNMPITQIFSKDQYYLHEPEYLEFLKENQPLLQPKSLDFQISLQSHENSKLSLVHSNPNLTKGQQTAKFTLVGETRISPSANHPCGCEEESCNKCWCDMIDSNYFSPPCCLCDFKPNIVNCHQFDSLIKDHKLKEDHCLHPSEGVSSPHEPWEHEDISECRPCSKYLEIKKELQKNPCKHQGYKLFK